MADTENWATEFFKDLQARQINTIVSHGITGRSMGSPKQGLQETVRKYKEFLESEGASSADGSASRRKDVSDEKAPDMNAAELETTFVELVQQAKAAREKTSEASWKSTIYYRIEAKSK